MIFRAGFAIRTVILIGAVCYPLYAGRCTNQSFRLFVYPVVTLQDGVTVTAAVQGDGNWYTGEIHICSGTYDATLVLPTKRKMSFAFPPAISGSFVDAPLPAGTYSISAFLNIRNLLCVGCANPNNPFTTHFSIQLPSLINRSLYRVRFMPIVVDAPDYHINPDAVIEENIPYPSSPALVIPQPYNCTSGGMIKPSWLIKGNTPNDPANPHLQVGTAHDVSKTPYKRAGQYSMPFEFRIEALSCFSY